MDGKQAARAWNAWLASKDGQDCMGWRSMGLTEQQQQYLHNRLWHAFMAGVAACEAITTTMAADWTMDALREIDAAIRVG